MALLLFRYRVAFHFRHYSFDHPDFLGSLIRKGTTMVAVSDAGHA